MGKPLPPHFSMPDELPGKMLDLGLGIEHVGLNTLAYVESSRHLLDGCLALSRVKALRGWGPKRQQDLIDAAIWRLEENNVLLLDYLDVNRSRAKIEELREAKAIGGKARAEAAAREPDGTFNAGKCPTHGKPWELLKYSWGCPTKVPVNASGKVFGWCQERPSQAWITQQMLEVPLVPTTTSTTTSSDVVRTNGTDADASGSSDSSGRFCGECHTPLPIDGFCPVCPF